ncbi:hypothetical protein ACPCK6_00005, partial [Micromonospora sp. AB353]
MARGPERPADGPDERRDPRGKGRRWGRGRAEPELDPTVVGEELGWIDDLRTAKHQGGELGPDGDVPAPHPGADPSWPAAEPRRPAAAPGPAPGMPPAGRPASPPTAPGPQPPAAGQPVAPP